MSRSPSAMTSATIDSIRELRDMLAHVTDKFEILATRDRDARAVAKAVEHDLGEALLELDTRMGWDD